MNWTKVRAVPHSSTQHVFTLINECVISRHGTPRLLFTDRGTAFTFRAFGNLLNDHEIRHAGATLRHPQTNGLVERTNCTIKDILSSYMSSSHNNWDEYVATAVFALNTSQQKITRESPVKLVYGRTPIHSQESFFGLTRQSEIVWMTPVLRSFFGRLALERIWP